MPVIALQRVEVLPDGASATYGSDAVAGVLNFITRKNYTGIETQGQYSFADNYSNYTAAILAGHEWEGGSVLLAYQYVYKSPLANGTRDYQTARQDLRLGALANPTAFAPAGHKHGSRVVRCGSRRRRTEMVSMPVHCAGMVMSGSASLSPVSDSVKSISMKANARLLFRSRSSIQNQ